MFKKRGVTRGLRFLTVSERNTFLISLTVIFIFVALAYGNSVRNGIVWDDETFVANNKFVHDLSRFPEYFTNPDDYAVQVRMAQEELASGEVSSALSRLERLMQGRISSTLPEYKIVPHYWYGRALLDARRFSEAYREFSIVVNISPKSFKDVSLFLAEAAANSGDITGARLLLERETKLSPDNDNVWNGLGNIQLMTADFPGAISSYRRALEINPRNKQAALNLQYAVKASRQSSKPHGNN